MKTVLWEMVRSEGVEIEEDERLSGNFEFGDGGEGVHGE